MMGVVTNDERPVDPLIARRRDASVLDLTPPTGRDGHTFVDDTDERTDGTDGTDGFGLFERDAPEPVAAWDRRPTTARPVPPQLLVLLAVVATVGVIWGITALRGPSQSNGAAPATTELVQATVGLDSVEQSGATVHLAVDVTSTAGVRDVLSNHVWIVRDGQALPAGIAFTGCLATDDELAKPLAGTLVVTSGVDDPSLCGVGGFELAPGGTAAIDITATGLAPGAYRVLVAAWTSDQFVVAAG
jgi:hypothetical protein